MAIYHGSAGSLKFNSTTVAQVQEWSVTHNAEMVETTSLADPARSFSKGLESFEGSAELLVVSDGTTGFTNFNEQLKTGTALTAIFFVDDTGGADVSLTGSVIVSSVETTTTFDDVARMSVTFTGTGQLTVDANDSN